MIDTNYVNTERIMFDTLCELSNSKWIHMLAICDFLKLTCINPKLLKNIVDLFYTVRLSKLERCMLDEEIKEGCLFNKKFIRPTFQGTHWCNFPHERNDITYVPNKEKSGLKCKSCDLI